MNMEQMTHEAGRARHQDAKAILDGDPRRDDQEGAAEQLRIAPHGVDRLPRDQHRHDRRFPAARRHFHGKPEQLRIGFVVRLLDLIQQPFGHGAFGSYLSQPDDRFNGFDLTEEGANGRKLMVAPVVKQASRGGCYAPIGLIRNLSPRINISANLIDKAVRRVGFQVERSLSGGARLSRFWNRNDELGRPPPQNRGLLEVARFVCTRIANG